MNENFETIVHKAGKQVTLTDAEREKMRYVLTEYRAYKPLPAPALPARAVWITRLLSVRGASVAAVLILALGSGTLAYAAEGTLPGDTLYPIKVGITEPLRTLVALSPSARTTWEMTVAERRISEAATLANEGMLGTSTELALEHNFEQNAAAATAEIAHASTTDPTGALLSATRFSTRLAAYQTVLASVDRKNHRQQTRLFQIALGVQATAALDAATNTESVAVARPRLRKVPSARDAAEAAQFSVESIQGIHAATSLLSAASSTLGASTSAAAMTSLNGATQEDERGQTDLRNSDPQSAVQEFNNSISTSERVNILTQAASTLKVNPFAPADAPDKSNE